MNKIFYSSLTSIIIIYFFLFSSYCLAGSNFNSVNKFFHYSEIDSAELEFKYFKRAKSLMSKKDYLGAIKELESIKTSGNAFLKQMLISCYIEIKNFPKAKIVLKEYYKSDGQSPSLVSSMKELEKRIATAYTEDSTSYQNFRESCPALKGYLKRCPYSFFAKEVLDRIDELDYQQAETINTEDAYMIYLSEHPNGAYASEAKSKISIIIAIQNDNLNKDALEFDRLAKKSMIKVTLYSTLFTAGGIGTYFVAKKAISKYSSPGQQTFSINDVLLVGFPILMICSASLGYRSFKSANIYRNNARNTRSQIRQIPSFTQIRISPFTDFSTTGGISLNIKF